MINIEKLEKDLNRIADNTKRRIATIMIDTIKESINIEDIEDIYPANFYNNGVPEVSIFILTKTSIYVTSLVKDESLTHIEIDKISKDKIDYIRLKQYVSGIILDVNFINGRVITLNSSKDSSGSGETIYKKFIYRVIRNY